MKRFLKYILISFLTVFLFQSCETEDDYKIGDYTNVEGYYPFLVNKGALVNNKKPHSGENFQIELKYYTKTPVSKITLMGKGVNGARLSPSERYGDLRVLKTYEKEEVEKLAGFSEEFQVDTILFNWEISSELENNNSYIYYKVAVENTNGLSDTTSGDYWKVKPFSSDARLKMITINEKGLESFDKSVFEYEMTLPSGTKELPKVTAFPNDASVANITINNAENLTGTIEQRTATIKVIAEDNVTVNVYKIVFTV